MNADVDCLDAADDAEFVIGPSSRWSLMSRLIRARNAIYHALSTKPASFLISASRTTQNVTVCRHPNSNI